MRKIKYLIVLLLLFPVLVYADCTREGDKFRTDGGLLVDPGSGQYNYYCLGIDHCFAKENKYYDINSNQVTLEEYYASCGCRIDNGHYYDNHGVETTEGEYNRICLNVGACSVKDGKYYDNQYKEVTKAQYEAVCGCRVENGKYYDTEGNETTVQNYNRYCLEVGSCSVKDGKYYDNNYNEVTQEEFNSICGCRVEGGKYYDNNGVETTEGNYNRVCLNVGPCTIKDSKYYDNNYNETTQEEFERICGCRIDGNKYYDKHGLETTQAMYEAECTNPDTGVTRILIIMALVFGVSGGLIFVLSRGKKQIGL